MRFFGNQPRFGIACFAVLCIFCLASAKLNADEPLLVLTIGASTEFELPYAVSEVYQVDEKAITVQFAKKTTLVRIEGQSIGDTSILLLDV